jgi:RHS repeat-associated protein
MERDTGLAPNFKLGFYQTGRVEYVHGAELDAPLSMYRAEYSDSIGGGFYVPLANWKGSYDSGYSIEYCYTREWSTAVAPPIGEPQTGSDTTTQGNARSGTETLCPTVEWPAQHEWAAHQYRRGYGGPRNWMGSLIYGQRDFSGLHYRRNRFYDAEQGRFTQEDPIGMAGGINLYGFANGDPVSYSDPYGLSAQSGCPPLCSGLNPRHLELEIQQAQSGKASVLALGELVRGGRVRATIARHESTISGAAAANGVDPALIKGIIFEEQTHQTPFEGALEARGEGSTVGLGQMTVGAHGTRRHLLNPTYNINAMGRHLGALQADGLIDPKRPVASLATKYNCGSCTSISAYGERVEKFHRQFSSP